MTLEQDTGRCRVNRAWRLASVDEARVKALSDSTGLSPVASRILVARGITTPEAAARFLDPDLERDWLDPALIPGMAEAAARVADAVRAREKILVFGDFDLDGISSAAIAGLGLTALGAQVTATIPDRFEEGYGLTSASIERILRFEPDLVITVDCGVSATEEVESLRVSGVDVVVTDHHEPGTTLPHGVPVADPKLDSKCPSHDIAGAGVALKLVQAVGALFGDTSVWRSLTDLAMLGTVADIVPLLGENRALVADGLARIRTQPRVGILALAAIASCKVTELTTDGVAYQIAPRLNAAGRMADPSAALRLLMTDDSADAESLAGELDARNRERQAIEQELTEAATALAEREFSPKDRALVLAGEGWHEGVKGIVASRLASRFGVPTILLAVDDGIARGSGRSVGSVDLYRAIFSASELLTRYGGHSAAVGVTLSKADVGEFRARLLEYFASLPEEQFITETVVDAEIGLGAIGPELVAEADLFEPFGPGNPRPVFSVGGVFMSGRERVGATSNHLRFDAYDGADSVSAIAFRCPDIERLALCDGAVDIAFELKADEWRGRRRVQMLVRQILPHEREGYSPAAELVEDLFARADEILAREEYVGIHEADSFHTKLVGVTFEGRQDVAARLVPGTPLRLVREPANPHDANAIALHEPRGLQVGYFNRRLAAALAPTIDAGVEFDVEVRDVTGGEKKQAFGVNVLVTRRSDADDVAEAEEVAVRRQRFAALEGAAFDRELVREFIGDGRLHDAQSETLGELARGHRCLTVMATGRGKSLIFHLHAARIALVDGGASVFVFPLRALVADQAFHLEEVMGRLGVKVCTLTGESPPGVREDTFEALADGGADILLTTPEFFFHHSSRFVSSGRVRFVVIDEAHHVGMSRAAHRPVYSRLGEVLSVLGDPAVLAVTATSGDATTEAIRRTLGIEVVVLDPTVRENLVVNDRRGAGEKDAYLAALAARGDKMIVYVNSREQSVRLARMIRKKAPGAAMRVAFYNGGLTRSARHAVERAFRVGDVNLVVATSAFGEGVNIPDVRHVVLYHLPFNEIEFNQMCGRGGRDGADAWIHLLFGPRDGKINEMVLASVAPSRDDLAALYVVLKELNSALGPGFEITNAELASRVTDCRPASKMNDRAVSTGLGILCELKLVESEGHGPYRRLTLVPTNARVDLASSVRYAEGLEEVAEFAKFRQWVLSASADDLRARFNRPILPSRH